LELRSVDIRQRAESAFIPSTFSVSQTSLQDGSSNAGADGTPFEAGSRYTHVYVRSDAGWRLLSAQGTEISRPA
jgi:hypothetical protein